LGSERDDPRHDIYVLSTQEQNFIGLTNDSERNRLKREKSAKLCFPESKFTLLEMVEPKFSASKRQFRMFVFKRKDSPFDVDIQGTKVLRLRYKGLGYKGWGFQFLTKGACLAKIAVRDSDARMVTELVVAGTHMSDGGAKRVKKGWIPRYNTYNRTHAVEQSQKAVRKQREELEQIIQAAKELSDDEDNLSLFIGGDINCRQMELPRDLLDEFNARHYADFNEATFDEESFNAEVFHNVNNGSMIVRNKKAKKVADIPGQRAQLHSLAQRCNAAVGAHRSIKDKMKRRVLHDVKLGDSMRYHRHWLSTEGWDVTEGKIDFFPTYTFDIKRGVYKEDKKSIPAYTDRHFLVRRQGSGSMWKLNKYTSLPEIKISDHIPVMASFSFSPRQHRLQVRLRRQNSGA